MNESQLKSNLQDLIALLTGLETVLPGKIDPELIAYLQSVEQNDWHLAALVNMLPKNLKLKKAM